MPLQAPISLIPSSHHPLPCRHLLPFEIRRRYFYCTALGLGRALHHIQECVSVAVAVSVSFSISDAAAVCMASMASSPGS